MMLEVAFWSSVLFVAYAYVIYPVVLSIVSVIRERKVDRGDVTPSVSFIIAAHNEEARLQGKIENTLRLEYPRDQLEIIVASDGSTDRTDAITKTYEGNGVVLVKTATRRGKESAQRCAVDIASGEVLVFSDVGATLPSNAVATIVRNFHDPTVGCVSSVDHTVDADGHSTGEGGYVRYEMLLRRLESKTGTLVGLSGSFFAARRELCREWPNDLPSDMHTLFRAVKAGLRGVSDPESIANYENVPDTRREFERKVRTVLRGISLFAANLEMANPRRYGLFAWQLLSHKLCRWLVPFALLVALASSALLIPHSTAYAVACVTQLVLYGVALGGMTVGRLTRAKLVRIVAFFVLSNLAILKAWYRFAIGDRVVSWQPSRR
jgi:cellulose synthase/poly-beta-1,6-N-acetylglucosamine synthase-like glycosyltransferase